MKITAKQLLQLWNYYITGCNINGDRDKTKLYNDIVNQQSDEVVDTEKPENAKMRFIAGEKKKDE
jgi:hypothetical protein